MEAYADFAARIQTETTGTDEFSYSAAELAALSQDAYLARRRYGVWDGDRLVAALATFWELDTANRTAYVSVLGVDPAYRRRGLAGELLDAAEAAIAEDGRSTVILISEHRVDDGAGERVRAPQGDASLPADAPAARFALGRGYRLGQLVLASSLPLAGRADEFRARGLAAERHDGYRLVTWQDRAPEEHVAAYAAARTLMNVEAPNGDLDVGEEHWDVERVRADEERTLGAGRRMLSVAAVAADGEIAGYTTLALAPGKQGVYQHDTIVLSAHRGRRLGMRMKLANLVLLADAAPERTAVYTWNADENDHMLAINRALGFRPHSFQATWQRG
nr:GNAT family N-acetyltransferase [Agromyces seonyuensis]